MLTIVDFSPLLSIVFFKCLGSQGFHDVLNKYIFFFSKRYEYCKTGALDIWVNFSDFLSYVHILDNFHEYKMSMRLKNGKNP